MAARAPSSPYERIYATIAAIPRGRVATYGQIAREAGLPGRARQGGFALRSLADGSDLPWHRVVNASGAISARGDGSCARRQRALLRAEGVRIGASGRIDLARFRWEE
jgi:methylated-DNA-protein-cysteine methyltransferase-like protein